MDQFRSHKGSTMILPTQISRITTEGDEGVDLDEEINGEEVFRGVLIRGMQEREEVLSKEIIGPDGPLIPTEEREVIEEAEGSTRIPDQFLYSLKLR